MGGCKGLFRGRGGPAGRALFFQKGRASGKKRPAGRAGCACEAGRRPPPQPPPRRAGTPQRPCGARPCAEGRAKKGMPAGTQGEKRKGERGRALRRHWPALRRGGPAQAPRPSAPPKCPAQVPRPSALPTPYRPLPEGAGVSRETKSGGESPRRLRPGVPKRKGLKAQASGR